MKLLADENIPDELVDILREKGHNVSRPPAGTKDPAVALIAKRENRIIVTQDKDFANIIWYPPKSLRGIIRLKIHPPILSKIIQRLDDLFSQFSRENLDGKLVILEEDGFRIR